MGIPYWSVEYVDSVYSILIEMKVEQGFLPLQVAIKYYQKWQCDVSCQMEDSIYYKCLNGNGSVEFLNGNSYTGGFKNGFMHGKGLYRWKNGLLYDGEISNNTVTGQGKLQWPDGSHYSGSVVEGRRHGYGEYYCSIDGSTYKGEWNQGVKEGRGVLSFANGAVFQGEFKAGLRHGHGKMKYQSGNEYQGGWREDKKEGNGVMSWHTTMERYEGEWKLDTPWGLGSYYWFQGKEGRTIKTIFKGEWKQGRREGFGTFFYNNGCRLEGTFANNLKEGVCYLVDQFGQGHLETFRGDKSILKKEEITIKADKKHFHLPQILKGGKETKEVKEVATGSSVLQVNEPQENSYWRFLDFECGLIDESICNVLLRENSQLRQWHRALMGNQGKEVFGGFSLEGLWRLVRDMRLTDESITLARLNREFFKGSKARFQVQFGSKTKLQTLKDNAALLTPHNYYSIEWEAFFEDARKLRTWQGEAESVDASKVSLNRELNIHSNQHTVLFRHFVAYILHLALLHHRQAVLATPSLTFRKCLEDLFCSIKQAVSPVGSFKTQKNCSEIMTNVSHNQSRLHIPEQYSAINRTLFAALSSGRPQLLNTKDQTVAVKQVYCLLGQCGLLREPAEKMLFLEKIERNMNVKGSLLRKDNKACYPQLEKVLLRSPHFTHILNYEMIEAELDDILYVFLNRKIGNTQSKQEFLKKYRETIKSLVSAVNEHRTSKATSLPFNYTRYSAKDKQKDEFLRKMEEERQRRLQEERKVQQALREQKERMWMGREDFDIKDEDPSETSQQYYD